MSERLPDWLILGAAKAGTTSVAYWLYERQVVYLAPIKAVRHRGSDRLPRRVADDLDRWKTVEIENPPMPARTRHRLLEHFAPHNAALQERLGRPLPGWDR